MKITGYTNSKPTAEGFVELDEIAIITPPETLRALASFLIEAADEMDELGEDYDHIHFMDTWKDWEEIHPDVQVLSKKYL